MLISASAVTGEGRVNVMNRDVTVLRRGTVEKSILPDRSALRRDLPGRAILALISRKQRLCECRAYRTGDEPAYSRLVFAAVADVLVGHQAFEFDCSTWNP